MAADQPAGFMTPIRERAVGVRPRTTAVAVVVVGAALAIASVAMVVLLRRSLTDDVRAAALLRAETAAARFVPDGRIALPIPDIEEEFVQILDADGDVVARSPNLKGSDAIVRPTPGDVRRVDGLPFEDDEFLVVAIAGPRRSTVVAGRTLETVAESSAAVIGILAVGIPLLLLVLAGVMWRVVGRALAPVEAIRSEVEAISARELHRRVPDPRGEDEIARLAATMNRMLARLESNQVRQRRFVSDASHELRSPVAAIRQHAEVALAHPNRTSTRDLAVIVLEEDLRLQQLVDDLLLLTRVDEGSMQLREDEVDLDDLLFAEAERLRASTDLRIVTEGVAAARVSGDRAHVGRLVRNLTDNAARHARTVVALSLRDHGGAVALAVDDDGAGIPAPDRERVFERFVRLDEARDRDSGGSGLGLAIVAEIAAAHDATVVACESALGGTRIEVRFASP